MSIQIKDVNFQYPDTTDGALQDINLSIEKGECILLTGASGCGKSTLTRLLNGLIPLFYKGELSGSIVLDGQEVRDMKSYELSKKVGTVFQNPRTQFFNVDTDSEITFGLENEGVSREEINRILESVTEELHLEPLRGRDIFQLSGGEKQKIAFASIYAMSPDVYILDEPSSNLDKEGVEELAKCLKKVRAQGKTILIAEHRIYYLMDIVDRVVYMKNGRIESIYSRQDFLTLSANDLAGMGLRASRLPDLAEVVPESAKEIKQLQQAPSLSELPKESKVRLCLKDLTIYRGGRKLIDHLQLELHAGQIVGVVGRNGVGKTTLLRTITGLHKEYDGEICLRGRRLKPGELRKKAYMVMQDVNYQLFADSVAAECSLGRKHFAENSVEEVLRMMGLAGMKDRHPNTLSGGQKQRLAIAVSMIADKEIIVFDEPTSGLDFKNLMRTTEIMKAMAAAGKILIVVTHDQEFIRNCCTDIVIPVT